MGLVVERGSPSVRSLDACKVPGRDEVHEVICAGLGQVNIRILGAAVKDISVAVTGGYSDGLDTGEAVGGSGKGLGLYLHLVVVTVGRGAEHCDLFTEIQVEAAAVARNGEVEDVRLGVHLTSMASSGFGAGTDDNLGSAGAAAVVKKAEHESPPGVRMVSPDFGSVVYGKEAGDMLLVLAVVRDASGLYGDTTAYGEVPSRPENARQLVGSVAVGGISCYDGDIEVLVLIFVDRNRKVDGASVHRRRNLSLPHEVPGISLWKRDVIVELEG